MSGKAVWATRGYAAPKKTPLTAQKPKATVAGFALGAALERLLRLWTGYPARVSEEIDHADP
jgi:hypothetical protein